MKHLFLLLAATVFSFFAVTSSGNAAERGIVMAKIQMTFGSDQVVIDIFDTPLSRDFLKLLPMTAKFEDFARAEKITRLSRKLDVGDSPNASEVSGDFSYYAPWGNIAVFYSGVGTDRNLYTLGRIISGKEKLAMMRNDFTATISLVE